MCFELIEKKGEERDFWKDNPYVMMRKLGYRFNGRVGVHFDAYPPDYDRAQPHNEVWDRGREIAKTPLVVENATSSC